MVLEAEYIRGDEMEGEREKGISRQNERKAFIKGMNLRQGEIYQHWVKGSRRKLRLTCKIRQNKSLFNHKL